MPIKILDQDLINKIAAGEVVDRPASVVKELIENSLDSGASSITVEIENGGMDLIRVIDDGIGMVPEDAKMAVRRHATSKIQSLNDLHNIRTLGFRGEALAAIAAVSKFRLITRQLHSLGAIEVSTDQGEVISRSASGAKGTMIEIRGLFYSVPARKKFLKSANTEFRYITEVLMYQVLLKPQVSWKLIHNKKTVMEYLAVTDWKDRVNFVLGKEMSENLLSIHHQRASLIIEGFIAHPAFARERTTQQYLFVNQRPIKDYLLSKAVKEGYGHNIPSGFNAPFVIQVSIAPDLVDVNVHPRKSEVKFADPGSVFREMVHGVKNTIDGIAQSPPVTSLSPVSYKKSSAGSTMKYTVRPLSSQIKQQFEFQQRIASPSRSIMSSPSFSFDNSISDDKAFKTSDAEVGDWKLIGQVHRSYLIIETEDGLLIIDQHAAAEKIIYEKLLANIKVPKIQALLVPMVVELTPDQLALIQEVEQELQDVGIEGEEFGGNSYRVTGIPQDLDVSDLKTFFFSLLSDIADTELGKIKSLEDRQKQLLKYAACRGAIKFNDSLSVEEQIKLLHDIQDYNVISCVHGRPAVIKYTKGELSKLFHRP